jgi:hypothetical protein
MMIALTDVRTSLREACREIRMRNPGGDVEPLLAGFVLRVRGSNQPRKSWLETTSANDNALALAA